MPQRQTSVGVGTVAGSSTFFPPRPVEIGRNRGVATLTLLTNGTSGASSTTTAVTTNERTPTGSGLTLTTTVSGGAVATVVPVAAGTGYRVGDIVYLPASVSGFASLPTFEITSVGSDGQVTGVAIVNNGGSGGGALTGSPAALWSPRRGANGLLVNATAAAGVVTTLAIASVEYGNGTGYRIGDIVTITVTGASTPVTAVVSSLTG